MHAIKNSRKFDRKKYFYALMMVLWSAKSTSLLTIAPDNMPMSLLWLAIIGFYYLSYCRYISKRPLLLMLGLYALWYVSLCVKYGSVIKPYMGFPVCMVISYVGFCVFRGKELFLYIEKVLLHLCILSLVVWCFSMLNYKATLSFMQAISVEPPQVIMKANIFLVGLGGQLVDGWLHRNIGFTWEAGRFSCFLVFAIFLNLSCKRMSLSWRKNKAFYILLAGLVTTFSTTGILSLFAVVFYYAYNKGTRYRMAMIVGAILLLPSLWGLSFVGGKLVDNADYMKEIHDMQWLYENGTEAVTPQRITGIYLELLNFINDKWVGYGVNELSYANQVLFGGTFAWLSNGFIQIFSMYGLLFGVFFYIQLLRSSAIIVNLFGYKGTCFFALLFVLVSVSYEFWTSSVFFVCVCYAWYVKYIPGGGRNFQKNINEYKS